jgi:upstream activation factor subunit UAF30
MYNSQPHKMPRQTKPSATPATTAAPVVAESAKKVSAKKTKTEVTIAPVTPAPTPIPAPIEVAPVAIEAESKAPVADEIKSVSSEVLLSTIDAKVQQVASGLSLLKNDLKSLRKQIAQDKKVAEKLAKKSSKKKRVVVEGEEVKPRNSGFMRPVRISDELASFLGKATGTVMGRQVANDEIRKYVTANNLKETEKGKGRNINPDAKLFALLKLPANEQLTYFNLQKYMKPHFIKIEEAVATA